MNKYRELILNMSKSFDRYMMNSEFIDDFDDMPDDAFDKLTENEQKEN